MMRGWPVDVVETAIAVNWVVIGWLVIRVVLPELSVLTPFGWLAVLAVAGWLIRAVGAIVVVTLPVDLVVTTVVVGVVNSGVAVL